MPGQNIPEENANNLEELASYLPTEWKSGDVVTSEKLNKIEAGITSMQTIIVPTSSHEVWIDGTNTITIKSIQYTAEELATAFRSGINIMVYLEANNNEGFLRLTSVAVMDGNIVFACINPSPSTPVLYWFAPSESDILMEFNQTTQPYIDQFYGTSSTPGGDEGTAT